MAGYNPFEILHAPLTGSNLVEASAGSGKTYAISNLYLRLLIERELQVEQILVVTFTEAATAELRDRIRSNLADALAFLKGEKDDCDPTVQVIVGQGHTDDSLIRNLRLALANFDTAAISTIHGFCRRVLQDNAFESTVLFDTELIGEQDKLIQECVDDFWRKNFRNSPLTAVIENGGISPEYLVKLAKQFVNRPMLKTVPGEKKTEVSVILDFYRRVIENWRENRAELEQLLLDDGVGWSRSKQTFSLENLREYFSFLNSASPDLVSLSALEVINMMARDHLPLKKKAVPPGNPFFDICQECVTAVHEFLVSIKLRFIAYLEEKLPERKRQLNVWAFDDLLLQLRAALDSAKGEELAAAVREKFQAALIDEFQDTDPIQERIFTRLFGGEDRTLYMIGDPKQSIYAFRNADIFAYFDAAGKTSPENRFTLDTNWRSASGFVKAMNTVFGNSPNPFIFSGRIGYQQVNDTTLSKGNEAPLLIDGKEVKSMRIRMLKSGKRKLAKYRAVDMAVDSVAAEIKELVDKGKTGRVKLGGHPLTPSDIAVLVMRHSDAERMKFQLGQLGIAATVCKAGNVFESEEARELEMLLLAVANPSEKSRLNAALCSKMIGCGAKTLYEMQEDDSNLDDYEKHWEKFREYREMWEHGQFLTMFRKFLADYGVRKRLLTGAGGERSLTNLLQLSELLHRAASEENYGIDGLLRHLAEAREGRDMHEEYELRLERDDKAVQIITVYKSKGLEFPVVFCPHLWQRGAEGKKTDFLFHRDQDIRMDISVPEGDPANREISEREELAELLRLTYVAITRARNLCVVHWGGINAGDSAPAYLFHWHEDSPEFKLEDLKKYFTGLNDEVIEEDLNRISDASGGEIEIREIDIISEPDLFGSMQSEVSKNLRPRNFTGGIVRDFGIASFTMLSSGKKHEFIADDEDDLSPARETDAEPEGFFAFPAGAVPGTCIHELFENIFTGNHDREKNVREALINYSLGGSEAEFPARVRDVLTMIERVMTAQLGDFCLSDLAPGNCLPEMEFYCPLDKISPSRLGDIYRRAYPDSEFPGKLAELTFSRLRGFMHGYIDLIFEHGGKYYLLDWKTNHLGNDFENYSPEILTRHIEASYYKLQYGIYTAALDKYLKLRVPGYLAERDFGGVYYLYVRGIHPDHPGCGIYYDRPPQSLIGELSRTFSERRAGA